MYAWNGSVRQIRWVRLIAEAAQRSNRALALLVTFDKQAWTNIPHNAKAVFCCCMGCPTIKTTSWRIVVYYTNSLQCATVDFEHDGHSTRPSKMATTTIRAWPQRCPLGQHQTSCSKRIIQLIYDHNRLVPARERDIGFNVSRWAARGWKDRIRRQPCA